MPALDGLRGVAVIAVLLFHGGYLVGGYLGVDLFFVLSGFLITSLLIVEREAGSIALLAFWVRRARRLLPALFLVLIAVAFYATSLAAPTELARIRGDAFAALLYYANWRAVFSEQTYWDLFSTPSPLAHMWSLAIEEQFYLVWPLLVLVTLRGDRGTRRLLALALTLAVGSAISLAYFYDAGETSRAYYGSDARASALACGAALAAWMRTRGQSTRSPRAKGLAWLAALVLAVAWATLGGRDPWLYRGGLMLCQLASVAVLASVSAGDSHLASALSWSPLRWVGRISYGLYLWHWPVFVAVNPARTGLDGAALFGLRAAISLALAVVSYYAFERPLRRGSFGGRKGAFIGVLSFLAVGASLYIATQPRGPQPRAQPSWVASDAADLNRAQPLRVLVAGDSVAGRLAAVMQSMDELGMTVLDGGQAGCGLVRGQRPSRLPDGEQLAFFACQGIDERWTGLSADVALLALTPASSGAYLLDGGWREACADSFDDEFEADAMVALAALHRVAPRVIVTTMPYVRKEGHDTAEEDRGTDCLNRRLRAAASASGAEIIDLNAYVCPHGRCVTHLHDVLLRHDGVHFEGTGAQLIGWWLGARIRGRA